MSNGLHKRPAKAIKSSDSSSDDDDAPLAKKVKVSSSGGGRSIASNNIKAESSDDSGDDSDAPLVAAVPGQRSGKVVKDEDLSADSDVPLSQTVKLQNDSDNESSDEDDDDDEDDASDGDDDDADRTVKAKAPKSMSITGSGDKKWDTLVHKGPRFPEPYVPLPPDVTLKYDGKPVRLAPAVEEVAMFYAVKLETQHASNAVFNRNFFEDFQSDLEQYPPEDGTKITSFEKLDFRDMYNHWKSLRDAETDRKKALAPSARKREIEERKADELQWKICLVDGVEQKVGNVNVEPPGLFLGRGAHPKAGRVKRRIYPSDITVNHSSDHPIPQPPPGMGNWAEVVEKKDVTWLAYWKENINGAYKYVFLDATSKFKTNSDRDKFEKARRLDTVVKRIRDDVNKNLKSKVRHERTIATVVWLIDNFSLRAGNEKGEDEAETYGVCSLRCEHAQVKQPDTIHLEFLGKDSMKFEEDLKISNPDVFKNLAMFLKTNGMKDAAGNFIRKKPSDPIFCAPAESSSSKMQPMAPDAVNKFLSKYMKGLSAKVFRTYNASVTFQGLLEQTEEWLKTRPTKQEREVNAANLRVAYNEANRQVAILCNHQKTVNPLMLSKNLERSQEKIFQIQYEIMKEQQKILTFYKTADLKKDYGVKEHTFMKSFDKIMKPQKLDANKVRKFEEQMVSDKKVKLESVFNRQQSELQYQAEQKGWTGKAAKKAKDVEDAIKASIKGFKDKEQVDAEIKALDDTLKRLERERKANKSEAASCNFVSSAKKILSKFEAIKKQEAELTNKNNTSDVALGTSKLNYIDPRITLAWLKKWDNTLVKMGMGKTTSKKKVKSEEEKPDVKPKTKSKAAKAVASGDDEKMDLGLQVLNMGQFFANALQKKFKWAASGDDGRDISADWEFVKKAQAKMRKFDSAARKGDKASGSMAAMTDAPDTEVAAATGKTTKTGTLKKQTAADRKKAKPIAAVDDNEDSSSDDDKPLAAT